MTIAAHKIQNQVQSHDSVSFDKAQVVRLLDQLGAQYRLDYSLAKTSWFKTGGSADIFYKPSDEAELQKFFKSVDEDVPVTVLGACSNVIIRDGGLRGVVIKMARGFNNITCDGEKNIVTADAGALDVNVALESARAGLGGLAFLSGIPGTIGGALRMNAGAYGGELKDVLLYTDVMNKKTGEIERLRPDNMEMRYRHNGLSADYLFLRAALKTYSSSAEEMKTQIEEIKEKRQATQPIKERTGGSTFANPTEEMCQKAGLSKVMKSWELIDAVGGRGFQIGGAKMSELHCNFMINTGEATSSDLEMLGEEMRRRVSEKFGLDLRWEIRRIGEPITSKAEVL